MRLLSPGTESHWSSISQVITIVSRQCHCNSVTPTSFMKTRCITGRSWHSPNRAVLSLLTAERLQSVEEQVRIIKRSFERLMAQFKVRMHLCYGLNKSSERHTHLCVQRCVLADISKDNMYCIGYTQSLGQNLVFIHGNLNQLMPFRQKNRCLFLRIIQTRNTLHKKKFRVI
jgi:hypothetical protein